MTSLRSHLTSLIVGFSLPLSALETEPRISCEWNDYAADQFSDCLALASQGVVSAQYTVGRAYLLGDGVERSQVDGEDWIIESAKAGYAAAEYHLALIYESRFGRGEESSLDKAIEWHNKAAKHGNADAKYSLALIYLGTKAGVKNVGEAIKLLSSAALDANTEASMYLYDLYKKGTDVSKNNEEAIKWLTQAAESLHPAAQMELGIAYLYGNDLVSKNQTLAMKWIAKAAEQGVAEAQVALGYLLDNEDKKNGEALKWFSKAMEQGRGDEICVLYFKPANYLKTATPGNLTKAVEWCSAEADRGNPNAQFAMAMMYKSGKGALPKNEVLAYKWAFIAEMSKHELSKELLKTWAATGNDEDRQKAAQMAKVWKKKPAKEDS